jgi:hypothetical protein
MKKLLILTGVLVVAGCATPTPIPVADVATPTPKVIYVTPEPTPEATPEPTAEPTPEPTPVPTPVPPKAVAVKGTCSSCKTKRFSLPAGDWDVTITGLSKHNYILGSDFGGGNVIMYLVGGTSGDYEQLVNEIVDGGVRYKFTTNVYGMSGGRYYVDVMAPERGWKVTFKYTGGGDADVTF